MIYMIYILEDQEITGKQFTHNEITYPSNWLELSTTEEKEAIGILTLEEIIPELELSFKYDGTYSDDFDKKTRTYNIVEKTKAELQIEKNNDNDMFNQSIRIQIQVLEATQPEIVREFLLGTTGSREKLQKLNDDINALKATLK